MLKGSIAVKKESPSAALWIINSRKKLIEKQILIEHGDNTLLLMADAEFKSPSGALVVIMGGNINGFESWKHKGQTLREYEPSILG